MKILHVWGISHPEARLVIKQGGTRPQMLRTCDENHQTLGVLTLRGVPIYIQSHYLGRKGYIGIGSNCVAVFG